MKPTRTHAAVGLAAAMGIGFIAMRTPPLDPSPAVSIARDFDSRGATPTFEHRAAENSAVLSRHRLLDDWTPPLVASPQPDDAEWAKSEKIAGLAGCEAHRTREWLRFDCPLAGPVRSWGVSISCRGTCDDVKTTMTMQTVHVILPVRPGVRRWIEVISNEQDAHATYGTRQEAPRTILRISEDWPDKLMLVVS